MSVTIGLGRWQCEQCGQRFDRERSGQRPIRFCGQPCYHGWNRLNGAGGGRFRQGATPWNRDLKGIHLSPDTEFKKGRVSLNRVPVGTEKIRHRRREKSPRTFVKVAEPNVWKLRAVVIWEAANGPVPKGKVIHHRDRDTLNDALDNLQALTRAEHAREHMIERHAIRRAA